MPRLKPPSKGAATLVVVIVLFFVMALVAAYANRNLLVEQRVSSAVLDAGLASEAAQFGLDHVLAVLNADAVDEQCRPVDAGGSSLRERLLSFDTAGRIQPRWSDPNRRPVACDRLATGDWSCQCPTQHTPNLVAPGTAKAWSVRVGVGPALASPGALTLLADGCAQPSAACGKGFDASDASSTHHVDAPRATRIGLLPALSQAPAATMTVRGDVNLGNGLRVVHGQLATAVRSGGAISGDTAGLRGAAGAVEPAALTDPALTASTPDLLLRRTFGMDSAQLPRHAKLRRLACDGSCQPALMALNERGAQFVRIEGDLHLTEPGSLGSPAQPMLLLVEGDFQLQAAVQMHGLLVVRGNAALQGPAASSVRGAVIVGGSLTGQAGAQVAWDAGVIQRLQTQVGSFIKLSGGDWSPP